MGRGANEPRGARELAGGEARDQHGIANSNNSSRTAVLRMPRQMFWLAVNTSRLPHSAGQGSKQKQQGCPHMMSRQMWPLAYWQELKELSHCEDSS